MVSKKIILSSNSTVSSWITELTRSIHKKTITSHNDELDALVYSVSLIKNREEIIMAKEVFMCRPCAEELKAAGKCIMHSPVKDKGDCYNCKRRRFGYSCEIVKRSRKNEKTDT